MSFKELDKVQMSDFVAFPCRIRQQLQMAFISEKAARDLPLRVPRLASLKNTFPLCFCAPSPQTSHQKYLIHYIIRYPLIFPNFLFKLPNSIPSSPSSLLHSPLLSLFPCVWPLFYWVQSRKLYYLIVEHAQDQGDLKYSLPDPQKISSATAG